MGMAYARTELTPDYLVISQAGRPRAWVIDIVTSSVAATAVYRMPEGTLDLVKAGDDIVIKVHDGTAFYPPYSRMPVLHLLPRLKASHFVYALMVAFSDDFYRPRSETTSPVPLGNGPGETAELTPAEIAACRLFAMSKRLPLEIQARLASRVGGDWNPDRAILAKHFDGLRLRWAHRDEWI